jgi:hypothetical protein
VRAAIVAEVLSATEHDGPIELESCVEEYDVPLGLTFSYNSMRNERLITNTVKFFSFIKNIPIVLY